MIKGEIALFSVKSKRKNAKGTYISKQIWSEEHDKAKHKFTKDDIYDVIGFACYAPYHNFKLVAYRDHKCICSWNNFDIFTDIESVINVIYDFMEMLNLEKFEFTRAELHNEPNMRYLIHKYYHGDN